jgi:hypothetical protein
MVARGRIYFGADNKVYAFKAARRNAYAYTYRYSYPRPATPAATPTARQQPCYVYPDTHSDGYFNLHGNSNSDINAYCHRRLLQRPQQRYRLVQHLRQRLRQH